MAQGESTLTTCGAGESTLTTNGTHGESPPKETGVVIGTGKTEGPASVKEPRKIRAGSKLDDSDEFTEEDDYDFTCENKAIVDETISDLQNIFKDINTKNGDNHVTVHSGDVGDHAFPDPFGEELRPENITPLSGGNIKVLNIGTPSTRDGATDTPHTRDGQSPESLHRGSSTRDGATASFANFVEQQSTRGAESNMVGNNPFTDDNNSAGNSVFANSNVKSKTGVLPLTTPGVLPPPPRRQGSPQENRRSSNHAGKGHGRGGKFGKNLSFGGANINHSSGLGFASMGGMIGNLMMSCSHNGTTMGNMGNPVMMSSSTTGNPLVSSTNPSLMTTANVMGMTNNNMMPNNAVAANNLSNVNPMASQMQNMMSQMATMMQQTKNNNGQGGNNSNNPLQIEMQKQLLTMQAQIQTQMMASQQENQSNQNSNQSNLQSQMAAQMRQMQAQMARMSGIMSPPAMPNPFPSPPMAPGMMNNGGASLMNNGGSTMNTSNNLLDNGGFVNSFPSMMSASSSSQNGSLRSYPSQPHGRNGFSSPRFGNRKRNLPSGLSPGMTPLKSRKEEDSTTFELSSSKKRGMDESAMPDPFAGDLAMPDPFADDEAMPDPFAEDDQMPDPFCTNSPQGRNLPSNGTTIIRNSVVKVVNQQGPPHQANKFNNNDNSIGTLTSRNLRQNHDTQLKNRILEIENAAISSSDGRGFQSESEKIREILRTVSKEEVGIENWILALKTVATFCKKDKSQMLLKEFQEDVNYRHVEEKLVRELVLRLKKHESFNGGDSDNEGGSSKVGASSSEKSSTNNADDTIVPLSSENASGLTYAYSIMRAPPNKSREDTEFLTMIYRTLEWGKLDLSALTDVTRAACKFFDVDDYQVLNYIFDDLNRLIKYRGGGLDGQMSVTLCYGVMTLHNRLLKVKEKEEERERAKAAQKGNSPDNDAESKSPLDNNDAENSFPTKSQKISEISSKLRSFVEKLIQYVFGKAKNKSMEFMNLANFVWYLSKMSLLFDSNKSLCPSIKHIRGKPVVAAAMNVVRARHTHDHYDHLRGVMVQFGVF